MGTKNYLIAYSITLVSLLIVDGAWIALVMDKIYKSHVPHLLADSFTLWPAAIFYIIYAFGICYFVVFPSMTQGFSLTVFGSGLLLGLLAYCAYDLTNHATLRDWPLFITVLDIAWGSFVTGLVALFTSWLMTVIVK